MPPEQKEEVMIKIPRDMTLERFVIHFNLDHFDLREKSKPPNDVAPVSGSIDREHSEFSSQTSSNAISSIVASDIESESASSDQNETVIRL